MGKIRWLHISDLHYDREMMGDWPVRQEDFPDKDIDFIVFTGDLHTYGRDLSTCYRSRISKEAPGVYRSRRLFAYSMQRRFRVFRVFALTDTPRHSAKPLLFPIQATLLTFLPVFESAAELK